MDVLIGCDPEICLMDGDKPVSAEGIVPGSKAEPHKVKAGWIQVDGFAAEIGTEPARTPIEFANNVETVLEELKRYTGNLTFNYVDSIAYPMDVYQKQSPEGKALGCVPDFNAYNGLENPMPIPKPINFRTFSGHIHIGWDKDIPIDDPVHFLDCRAVAKQMDWWLGVPCLKFNRGLRRRALYGKAGAFRPKSYGCEYRVLDNAWLSDRSQMEYVCSNAIKGMEAIDKGDYAADRYSAVSYINNGYEFEYFTPYTNALGIPLYQAPKKKAVA